LLMITNFTGIVNWAAHLGLFSIVWFLALLFKSVYCQFFPIVFLFISFLKSLCYYLFLLAILLLDMKIFFSGMDSWDQEDCQKGTTLVKRIKTLATID
jgi:hypothetical protein